MIPRETLKKIRRIEIRTRRAVNDVFAGRYHSVFKGQGMEFQEVREYVPGDDIRSIDWNVTARTGMPFVKKFVEERELTVMLLVDVSASNRFGSSPQFKRDLIAELAAILAFSAISNHDRVGLILFSDRVERYIPPRKGITHVLRVVTEILEAKPESPKTDIETALSYLNKVCRRRAVTFLLSDFVSPPFEHTLRVTAKRHDVTSLVIRDPHESVLPDAGLLDVVDPETGERLLVDTSYAPARLAFAQQETTRHAALLKQLQTAGADHITLEAGVPYDKPLIQFFKQREGRR